MYISFDKHKLFLKKIHSGYFYYIAQILARVLFIRWMIPSYNRQNIISSGPLMIVANHVSILDPWLVSIQLPIEPNLYWVSKKELWSYEDMYVEYKAKMPSFLAKICAFLTVYIVKHSYTIPFDRDQTKSTHNRSSYVQILKILHQGGIIGIFPEGGLKKKDSLKVGFVKFTEKYNATILPVFIEKETMRVTFRKAIFQEKLSILDTDIEKAEYVMKVIYDDE